MNALGDDARCQEIDFAVLCQHNCGVKDVETGGTVPLAKYKRYVCRSSGGSVHIRG